MFKYIVTSLLLITVVSAQQIIPPSNMFRDQKFLKEFVGSYGFLSEVEPRVTLEEQEALTSIRDLFEQSKFREAEEQLKVFIEELANPKDRKKEAVEISPAMIFVMGNLYFQAGRNEDARKSFLEAIKRFPRFRRAHTNLAYLYISQNKTEDALPILQRAIELGENSARIYGLLGYCYLLKKNALAAENAYRQAYLLDATSRDWKLGLAQALIFQEKYTEGVNLMDTLIDDNPNDKQLWLQQTNSYLALERKNDAIVNLEILRCKGIADEGNLNLLGNLYMDQNEPQLSLLAYLAAIEKAKVLDVPRALKSARILNDYGHPDKAEQFVTAIRTKLGEKIEPADLTALLLVEVRISQSKTQPDRTSELLDKLLELNPADSEVLLELARHKDMLSRDESDENKRADLVAEAKTNYQLAARVDKVAYPSNLSLGQMLVRERRYSEALVNLQAALNLKKSESLEQYVSRVRRAADRLEDKEK